MERALQRLDMGRGVHMRRASGPRGRKDCGKMSGNLEKGGVLVTPASRGSLRGARRRKGQEQSWTSGNRTTSALTPGCTGCLRSQPGTVSPEAPGLGQSNVLIRDTGEHLICGSVVSVYTCIVRVGTHTTLCLKPQNRGAQLLHIFSPRDSCG